jgi:predicted nucleic acid-binding protein
VRILVDTSVWIDFLQGATSPPAESLARFLEEGQEIATCGVVVAEIFQGIRSRAERSRLEPRFRHLLYLAPSEPDSYFEAAALFRGLRQRGVTIRSTIDCLIAVLAAEHDAFLLTRDRDFDHILASGLCSARAAPL